VKLKAKIKCFVLSNILLFPAIAVASERADTGMGLVYGFLALCLLIIVLQCLPILLMAWGIIRGIFSGRNIMSDEK